MRPCSARNAGARCDPPVIGLKPQSDLVIKDLQVTVPALCDRLGHDCLQFLGDNADIGFVAAAIGEAIEANAIAETTEKGDVVLKPDIGPPPAAASSETAARKMDASCARKAAATDATDARMSALGMQVGSGVGLPKGAAAVPGGSVPIQSTIAHA